MQFGLSAYDLGATELADLATAAEAAGFDTLWLGEHLLRPVDYRSVHPTRRPEQELAARIVGPDTQLTDPLSRWPPRLAAPAGSSWHRHLPAAAAASPRGRQGDADFAGAMPGRLLFGVGLGWLREEFEALGVPFAGRAARFDEAWTSCARRGQADPSSTTAASMTSGRLTDGAAGQDPAVLGGNTAPALRRAALLADGWFASGTPSLSEAVDLMRGWRGAGRAGRAVPLTTYVRASPAADVIPPYAAAGYSQLIFWAHELCPPGPRRWDRLAAVAPNSACRTARHGPATGRPRLETRC